MGRNRGRPPRWPSIDITRRDALRGAGTLGLGFMLGNCSSAPTNQVRAPGSRPNPSIPEGTDSIPQIEHVVIVMMENHSFDNYFGMLDPSVGFSLSGGKPSASCADSKGNLVSAFHMPSTCQLDSLPSQAWNASHIAYADGRNDGFVLGSGPVAMGYFAANDIPFYYGLARTFPLASRWFCSTLCQTYPNRRFLMAGTAAGIIDTSPESLGAPAPPNGNIFERLDANKIRWANYHSDLPSVAILPDYAFQHVDKLLPMTQFFTDAASGNLPAVSLVDPSFSGGSEENPDDIQIGEQFVAQVISAVMSGPGWAKTLLVWLYDEHGGYYDHVPPPAAIAPDDIPPDLTSGDLPGAYDRYGFRVPAVIVSPYARTNYVSSVVRDHTAILRFIERKWNLPALTHRDANADDLLDCLDFVNPPAFLVPPRLPAPALGKSGQPTCTPGKPGYIPDTVPYPPAIPATGMAGPLAMLWNARMAKKTLR